MRIFLKSKIWKMFFVMTLLLLLLIIIDLLVIGGLHWILNDSKSPQYTSTLLSIQYVLVVALSGWSLTFLRFFARFPIAPTTSDTTDTFLFQNSSVFWQCPNTFPAVGFILSLLSSLLEQWNPLIFTLFTIIKSGFQAWIRRSVWSKVPELFVL